jgi:hypothetical protein
MFVKRTRPEDKGNDFRFHPHNLVIYGKFWLSLPPFAYLREKKTHAGCAEKNLIDQELSPAIHETLMNTRISALFRLLVGFHSWTAFFIIKDGQDHQDQILTILPIPVKTSFPLSAFICAICG